MKYGSLINYLAASESSTTDPEVGQGVTGLYWSDRKPGTVVAVERFKSGAKAGEVSAIWVTWDTATRTDANGMSDAQSYSYATNWDAPRVKFTKRKDGGFRQEGGSLDLRVGVREKYYDYSF